MRAKKFRGHAEGFSGETIQRSPTASISTSPSTGSNLFGNRSAQEFPALKIFVIMYLP